MTSPDDFTDYVRLADELIEKATKNQVAEVARLLALKIGYYHQKFGAVPPEFLRNLERAEALDTLAESNAISPHIVGPQS